jgi:hypothetical protein
MITKRFLKVHSNEIVIFKVNFKFKYEKFRVFVTFYKNLHTGTRLRSRAKKRLLRLRLKVSGSATLVSALFCSFSCVLFPIMLIFSASLTRSSFF